MANNPVKRLVICVDGTWFDPSGAVTRREANNSNVYRVWSLVKQGTFIHAGRPVKQVALYDAGVGDDRHPIDHFNDTITTTGCEPQIEKIFAFCCEQLTESTDELWMYGFSRGAHVVRVVTELLHQLASLDLSNEVSYQRGFAELPPFREGSSKIELAKKIFPFLRAKARDRKAVIHFLGLFDTIKLSRDQSKPNPPSLKSVQNVRHALALNETRKAFQPSPYGPLDSSDDLRYRSLIEAWFIGSHADIGGGPRDDGLSLYPLQWILLESRGKGLVLEQVTGESNQHLTEEPMGLVFPAIASANSSEPPKVVEPWKFKYVNGIEVEMIDMRSSHRHGNLQSGKNSGKKKTMLKVEKVEETEPVSESAHPRKSSWRDKLSVRKKPPKDTGPIETDNASLLGDTAASVISATDSGPRPHAIKIHPGAQLISLFSGPRTVFHLRELIGFMDEVPCGTIIHPSIFFISDLYDSLGLADPLAAYIDDLDPFRRLKVSKSGGRIHLDPWRADLADYGSAELKNCRVLVCGRAGVGKSTLINKVFGTIVTQESFNDHGVHDVDEGFEMDSFPGLIVHDSRGFQSGTTREIELLEKFVKKRAGHSDPEEKLNAIWFCIDVPSTRIIHEADKKIFEILDKYARSVPVIIVRTMKDRFINEKVGEFRDELEDAGVTGVELDRQARAKAAESFLRIREEDILQLQQKLNLAKDFAPFVYVSKRDSQSIKELVKQTVALVPDNAARRNFVSAQIADSDPKVKESIEETLRLLNYANWATMAGTTLIVGSAVSTPTISRVLCLNIVKCFGLAETNIDEVESIAQRVLWRNFGTFLTTGFAQLIAICSLAAGLTFATLAAGLPLLAALPFAAVAPAARMITKCACDLILILEAAFSGRGTSVTGRDFHSASAQYCSKTPDGRSSIRTLVHRDIDKLIPVVSLKFYQPMSIATMRTQLFRLIQRYQFVLADVEALEIESLDSDAEDVRRLDEWRAGNDDIYDSKRRALNAPGESSSGRDHHPPQGGTTGAASSVSGVYDSKRAYMNNNGQPSETSLLATPGAAAAATTTTHADSDAAVSPMSSKQLEYLRESEDSRIDDPLPRYSQVERDMLAMAGAVEMPAEPASVARSGVPTPSVHGSAELQGTTVKEESDGPVELP
ncbi:hypothetical protein F4778DRAFT_737580 [Xylariomycetidae sp. FL2044]|nr:hypothetical protein F4778DRAFT_737580 [Xylariomycetidae sp. FL2044]